MNWRIPFLSLIAIVGAQHIANAQCVGAGGVPFNCTIGTAPQLTDSFLAGAQSGPQQGRTVQYTGAQIVGLDHSLSPVTVGGSTQTLAAWIAGTANAANISSGTLPPARLPTPTASTLGGVESAAAVAHQWVNSISTSGVPALSQPAFTDLSGNPSLGQVTGGLGYTPLAPANNLSDLASAATARTNLGLGALATQSASGVAITGGSIGGLSSLGVTGAATFSSTINGATLSGGTLSGYNGNLFLGAEQNAANFTGTESNFVGDRAGGAVGSGGFNWVGGHDAFGIGGGCANIYMGAGTVTGTDNLRNTCGGGGAAGFDTYGEGVLKTYNQAGTASNNYLTGIASFGAGSLYYWNGAVSNPYNTVFGNSGCTGASTGTVNFTGVTCLGPRSGVQLTGATNSILINGGGQGGCVLGCTNFASGSGVILISTGKNQIDTPAAGTTNFINEENAYIASTTGPSWVSGFNNSAGFHGGTGGGTSKSFQWNTGTGTTASSGVIAFAAAAPNGWVCFARDETNPALYVEDVADTSPTTITVTNYSRTTGAVTPWSSGDVLQFDCDGK